MVAMFLRQPSAKTSCRRARRRALEPMQPSSLARSASKVGWELSSSPPDAGNAVDFGARLALHGPQVVRDVGGVHTSAQAVLRVHGAGQARG
jgi:hypothetical protein